MSYVITAPEMMTSAAADLATIGSDVSAAHLAAVAPTVSLIPAAADEVSAAVTHLFSQHAASYQALAGQAAAFQEQFVQHLHAAAFSYADIEATIARFLQTLQQELPAFLQNLPANVKADVSLLASDPVRFLTILLGLVIAPVFAPLFVLFVAFWIAAFLGLAGLGLLAGQLTAL